jgi:uncharacterized protein (TIGR04255 family)
VAIQYQNAPIKEALIDIRADLPPGVDLDALEALHDVVRSKYPTRKRQAFFEAQFAMGGEEASASTKEVDAGLRFQSADGKQITQFRLQGFTFSRLQPYGTWDQLRDEARDLWRVYRERLRPTKITRLAVRYINYIELPLGPLDYKDYFRTTPEVGPGLPQELSSFFMQLFLPQQDLNAMVQITQASVNTNAVILDIDVYRQLNIPLSEDEMWTTLEQFRVRKNVFFEGSITDQTRALFGPRREY